MISFKKSPSLRTVIILTAATYALFFIMIFITIPSLAAYTSSMPILDMKPTGYSLDYILELFELLGDEGQNYYLTHQIPLDFIYPALFAITGYYTLLFLRKKLGWSYAWIGGLPLLAGLMDYLENIGIIIMLKSYPTVNENLAQSTSISSIIKSTSTTLYFIALLVLIIALIIQYIRKEKLITA